jgi:murein hydrolase activator
MTSKCLTNAAAALALWGFACGAIAQTAEPKPEDLQAVEQDLELSAERQKQLQSEATAALEEQDRLSNQLVTLAETISTQEQAKAKSDERQGKLKTDIAKLNLELASQQDVIAELLVGLQQLEHNPPPALIVAPDDVLGALRSAMVFGAILPELRGKAQAIHDKLALLKNLREKLDAESITVTETLAALTASRAEAEKLMGEKKALALASAEALAAEQQRAEELAAKATTLKELLAALEKAREEAVLKATAEAKAKADAAAEAERLLQEKLNPTIAFALAKGQINYPTLGRVIKAYGEDTGLGSTLDGIVIETKALAQVTTPVAGKVEFAGKFRTYGEMVIINPGDGYLVLLAGLGQVSATHGQSVKAGEPVGQMGERPSKMALSGGLTKDLTNAKAPMLYVEFRKNGDPVDPTPWWADIRQEAMR